MCVCVCVCVCVRVCVHVQWHVYVRDSLRNIVCANRANNVDTLRFKYARRSVLALDSTIFSNSSFFNCTAVAEWGASVCECWHRRTLCGGML
jgi:hypothetical protein